MNAKLREALDKWERDRYGPGYWDGYIEGMVAADPKLEKELIVWQCTMCKKLMTDVAYNSFSQPSCPHDCHRLIIVKDSRKICCELFEELVNNGVIEWRGGRYWLTTYSGRVSDMEYHSFKHELTSVVRHCMFCGKKVANEVDKE